VRGFLGAVVAVNKAQLERKLNRLREKQAQKLASLPQSLPCDDAPALCRTEAVGRAYKAGRRWLIAISMTAARNAELEHKGLVTVVIEKAGKGD